MAFDRIYLSGNINESIHDQTKSVELKALAADSTYLVRFVATNSARYGRLLSDDSIRVDRVLADPPDIQGRLETRYHSYTDSSVGYFAEIDPCVRELDLRRLTVKIRCPVAV